LVRKAYILTDQSEPKLICLTIYNKHNTKFIKNHKAILEIEHAARRHRSNDYATSGHTDIKKIKLEYATIFSKDLINT
jgi:hypothetical protein